MKKLVMSLLLLFATGPIAVWADLRLIEAVKVQDLETIHQLLKEDSIDVNERQEDGATALHWAIHKDDLDLAEQLIQAGAVVNVEDQGGATPLWVAAYNDSLTMVNRLLVAGANPNVSLYSGETPLMTASAIGSLEVVKTLLSAKADVAAKENLRGQTALMWAMANGHHVIANTLIESGADVREHSKSGFTPLHFASLHGSLESAKVLLSMDAEVNEASNDEVTPLLIAAANGHDALTQYLLEHGADPTIRDYRGFTALHYAAMKQNMLGSLRSLIARGAELNARVLRLGSEHELQSTDIAFLQAPTRIIEFGTKGLTVPTGATALYLAAQQRNAPAMRLLLENGADINLTTTETVYLLGQSGRRVNFMAKTTPLMTAAGMDRVASNWNDYRMGLEQQALEAVQIAVEAGSDVNAANDYGMTALHAAVLIGAHSIVEFLIKSGANLEAKDQYGQTPLSISRHVITKGLQMGNNFDVRPRRYRPEITSFLLAQGATPLEQSGVEVFEEFAH